MFSFHERHLGNVSVVVSHLPDDGYAVRIAFRHNGETVTPVMKLGKCDAEMLWAALNSMAKDLKWKDFGDVDHNLEPKPKESEETYGLFNQIREAAEKRASDKETK